MSIVFIDVNVGVKNHNFKFPLILDRYDIMIVMQNLKFIQELTSAVNVGCLHSNLQTKLQMQNCASVKKAISLVESEVIEKLSRVEN